MRNVIQVIVVLLILLSCGGLFTGAVVQVRAAAARAQCTNNLKQLGMAPWNYRDTYGTFPTAAIPNPDLPSEKRLSWIVNLVPFVEANNIYARMDKEKSWDAEENRFATEMRLKYLQCPGYYGQPANGSLGPTNYVGISGIGENAITLPREDSRAGFFGYDHPVKRADLKRGTPETILLVETSQASGAWTAAGRPTTRGLEPDGAPYFGSAGQFGGNHLKGANVTFADGSVRFVEKTIDSAVWEAMATLSGKGNQD